VRHNNLKAEMARRDVTISAIAEFLNVRFATISDKINGRSRFYFHEALRIRNQFFQDFSLEYLFEYEEEFEGTFNPELEDESSSMEVSAP